MATTPIIQSTGSTSGAGTPGQGRNNLVPGETITLSDTVGANVGAAYLWAIVDAPIGTSPSLIGPTTATPTFVVDASSTNVGSYRITCLVNGQFSSVIVIAAPLAHTGARIPSFNEELDYNGGGNAKGWHEAQTVFMRQVDAEIGGGGGAVVFDDSGGAGVKSNARTDRVLQSPIDNTKSQITNLGSQDGSNDPGATGATGTASTIGGGDDNTASGNYSTVVGGGGNAATGNYSTVSGGFGNVAGGDQSHAEGESTTTSQRASHAEGHNTQALGAASHAEGYGGIANGSYDHVEGLNCSTSGDGSSHAEGSNTQANGESSHSEGDSTVASGDESHAEGSSTQATELACHAEGQNTVASGQASHAEGRGSQATGGFGAHAEGYYTIAFGDCSHASGEESLALREAQRSHACGPFVTAGDAQTSVMVLRGTTPGAATNEAVSLKFGDPISTFFELEDGKAYACKVTCVIGGIQAGPTRVSRSIEIAFNARRDGGTTVITGSGPGAAYGDVATATWTLVASVGAGPDRVALTFNTGAGTKAACSVVAKIDFTEVGF